ncbi:hypothetical protein PanWU01x14_166450 [Parasponia andersonii]|uniref:Uncharacterized protein n=1 Tax=Parasponia andersonii TaxID=3476 RepID=A0A2P5CBJ4_PARAD|nr:hypothetical protein PanWU01x14_166450 [Parasponia andersonii]
MIRRVEPDWFHGETTLELAPTTEKHSRLHRLLTANGMSLGDKEGSVSFICSWDSVSDQWDTQQGRESVRRRLAGFSREGEKRIGRKLRESEEGLMAWPRVQA